MKSFGTVAGQDEDILTLRLALGVGSGDSYLEDLRNSGSATVLMLCTSTI
jgi:hypothetical protein